MSAGTTAAPTHDALRPQRGPLRNRSGNAIFLCYHSIAAPGPAYTSIAPAALEAQLGMLRSRGYESGTLEELRMLAAGERVHGRRAFLSFDDGYRDNLETALPLLRRHGFTATVFVLPPYVDSGADLDWPEVADRHRAHPEVMRSLTWELVEQLAEAGWEIGSHGLRHSHLTALGDAELREELEESRRRIADRVGRCELLAYPFGEWDGRVAAAAAAAGYSFAFSLPDERQASVSRMSIPRIMVDHADGERRFALKLSPAGRRLWLSPARDAARAFRNRLRG